jgi:hypothetical protein
MNEKTIYDLKPHEQIVVKNTPEYYFLHQINLNGENYIKVSYPHIPDLIKALVKGMDAKGVHTIVKYASDYQDWLHVSKCSKHNYWKDDRCQKCGFYKQRVNRLTKLFGDTE